MAFQYGKNGAEHSRIWRGSGTCTLLLLSLLALLALSACHQRTDRTASQSPPEPMAGTPKMPPDQLYFYPKTGQSNEQQSRDHFECYNWAVKQTHFDPAQSAIPPAERVRVVPMPPPGHDTATFAIAGAVLGALIAGPRHAVGGALVGASGGAIAGAASDTERAEAALAVESAFAQQDRIRAAQLAKEASGFRRAMSACMEGRGYTVR